MRKLQLKLDDLLVDSFQTTMLKEEKGTVVAEEQNHETQFSYCWESCEGTCGPACVSRNTCEYFTCSGYLTDWYGACVIC